LKFYAFGIPILQGGEDVNGWTLGNPMWWKPVGQRPLTRRRIWGEPSSGETGGDADGRTGDGVEQKPHREVENRDCVSNVHCGNLRGLRMHQESVNSPGGVLHTFDSPLWEWVRAVP